MSTQTIKRHTQLCAFFIDTFSLFILKEYVSLSTQSPPRLFVSFLLFICSSWENNCDKNQTRARKTASEKMLVKEVAFLFIHPVLLRVNSVPGEVCCFLSLVKCTGTPMHLTQTTRLFERISVRKKVTQSTGLRLF